MSLGDEIKAAKALTESLASLNDEELIADTIEGETSLFEIFDKMLESNISDSANIEAIDIVIEKLKARKDAAAKRIDTRKALIAQSMDIAGITKVKRALGTLSYRNGSPKTIITDETQIPARFWVQQALKLDKKALTDALKNNEKIEGASLSNGAPVLAIRV